jgi:hypothetical protein
MIYDLKCRFGEGKKYYYFKSGSPEYDRLLEKYEGCDGLIGIDKPRSLFEYFSLLNEFSCGVDLSNDSESYQIILDLASLGKKCLSDLGEEKEIIFENNIDDFVENIVENIKNKLIDHVQIVDKRKLFYRLFKDMDLRMKDTNYFIVAGTLLGYYREHNFLEWDKDIDIGIMYEDFMRIGGLEGIKKRFLNNNSDEEESQYNLVLVLGTEEDGMQISFMNNGIGLDIFVYYDFNDKYYNLNCYYRYHREFRFLYNKFTIESSTLLGYPIQIPGNPIKHIENDYGSKWNVPDPNFCWYNSENAVYPFGYGLVDCENYEDVNAILKSRVYGKIFLYTFDDGVNDGVDIIKVDSIESLVREIAVNMYSYPNKFSCFYSDSKKLNGNMIDLFKYDMAILKCGGYLEDEYEEEEFEEVSGFEIDWETFSTLSIEDMLTIPERYRMHGIFFYKILAESICNFFGINRKMNVVEFGCGVGAVAQHLKKIGIKYVGVDNCKEIIDKHLELSGGECVIADFKETGLGDKEYDFVYMWDCLRYLGNLREVDNILREMERVVKKGGVLFLGDVDVWSKDYFLFTGWELVDLGVGGVHFYKRM